MSPPPHHTLSLDDGVVYKVGIWGHATSFSNPLTYFPANSQGPKAPLLGQNLHFPPHTPEKEPCDRPLKKSAGNLGSQQGSEWLVSGPFPRADYWKGQSFGPGGPAVPKGRWQRKTVTREPAEGISNKLLTSQLCCGLPKAWPCL